MNSFTLDEQLDVVHRYILKRFATHQQLEDLIQEAKVVAWKMYMDGEDSQKICVKSRYRCLELISDPREPRWLGTPPRDGKNYAEKKGEETRQAIREYVTSYCKLHGHNPSNAEIAKHLGLATQSVAKHMDRLYLFTGPTDIRFSPLEGKFWEGSDDESHSVADHIKFGYSFEDDLVDKLDTWTFMKDSLDVRERTWVYHKVFEGLSYPQIAQLYGYSASLVSVVVRGAMKKLRAKREEQ